ncbi:MAG: cytochrome c3 family protein [bacterium]|nr:cytochrome c3 family protein [bacterium]
MKKLLGGIFSVLFLSTVVFAAAPEKVTIEHWKKKKSAVVFEHKKHGEMKDVKCVNCHHKKADGEKAEETKCSDAACHAKVQEKDKQKIDASSSSAKENPFHIQCIGCHKTDKEKKAPTKCDGCHPKAAGEKEEK